jgi:hypothetical protein
MLSFGARLCYIRYLSGSRYTLNLEALRVYAGPSRKNRSYILWLGLKTMLKGWGLLGIPAAGAAVAAANAAGPAVTPGDAMLVPCS